MEAVCADSLCKQCGKPLGKKSAGRKLIYCPDECRRSWVKNHPFFYENKCMLCGKEFESQTKNQKFCSHDCCICNRFWRKEDTEEIMKVILAEKKVLRIPNWLKDILNCETN